MSWIAGHPSPGQTRLRTFWYAIPMGLTMPYWPSPTRSIVRERHRVRRVLRPTVSVGNRLPMYPFS